MVDKKKISSSLLSYFLKEMIWKMKSIVTNIKKRSWKTNYSYWYCESRRDNIVLIVILTKYFADVEGD